MPNFTEMEFFGSLPATVSSMAEEGSEAGALGYDPQVSTSAPGVAAEEHYFDAVDLDEQPHPLQDVSPKYPAHAAAHDLAGWVRLQLLIDETGQIRHLEVVDASPHDVFDEAALSAFRFAQFSPAIRAGIPVKSRIMLKVNFEIGQGDNNRREGNE